MLLAVSSIRRLLLLLQLCLPFWCPPFSLHASRSDNNRHKMKYTVTKVCMWCLSCSHNSFFVFAYTIFQLEFQDASASDGHNVTFKVLLWSPLCHLADLLVLGLVQGHCFTYMSNCCQFYSQLHRRV